MRRALKIAAYLAILAGLLIGPAYWANAKFYTGSDAALVTLKADASKPGLARTWYSEPFQLREDMAQVGLILVAQGRFAANLTPDREPKDRYSAVLALDGQDAKPLAFSLGVKRVTETNPTLREHLLLLSKIQPGQYTLSVSQVAEPAIEIDAMQLQVRQNLREPDPTITTVGISLLILGILALTIL